MVRLLLSEMETTEQQHQRFNPTMVRLLLAKLIIELHRRPSFNPTMVRLLLFGFSPHPCHEPCFNPTMVRLLPGRGSGSGAGGPTFQSHNGAIAANPTMVRRDREVLVSIPQWCDCCGFIFDEYAQNDPCFNPTMVRLLRGVLGISSSNRHRFNPTMVRLLPIGFSFSCKGLIQFQSHNGAIAAEKGRSVVSTRAVVSIPQWCDCCTILSA